MRHRSVIAFILLAAALVAAPQVAHDFASLKSAVGARIRGEILRAFLNLHAGDGAGELKTRRADAAPVLASCAPEAKTDEQLARAEQRRDEERAQAAEERAQAATRDEDGTQVAPRAEAAPQADAHRQLAMLIVPSPEREEPSAVPPGVDDLFIHGKAEGLPRRAESTGELAMLIPPGLGFDVRYAFNAPHDAGLGAAGVGAQAARADRERRRSAEGRRSSGESRRRASSQEAHSAAVAAPRFETAALSHVEVSSKFQGEQVLKNLGPLVREAVWTRAAQGGMKVRVFKVRCKAGAIPAPAAPPVGAPRVSIQTSADE